MEAEERPAKIRKLSHDAATNGNGVHEVTEPESAQAGQINHPEPETESTTATIVPRNDTERSADAEAKSTTPATSASENAPGAAPLSKNQQKKLRRQQEWEAKRDDRKVRRKEKTVARRERKREEKAAQIASGQPPPAPLRRPHSYQLPITFVIDCDFDDLMRDNERISLAGQVTRSYSDVNHAQYKAHLAICSFTGKLRERFDGVLNQHYLNWHGVKFLDEDFVVAAEQAKEWMKVKGGGKLAGPTFGKYNESVEIREKVMEQGEVVYLSSDSDETLTELKPYSTYIIGGLVDKNREKGICHKRAMQKGIRTARLPIGDYMEMSSRKVLATNHVNEIMLRWLECGDWGEAFMKVMPKRKGGLLKNAVGQSDDEHQDEDEPDGSDATSADSNAEVAEHQAADEPKGEFGEKESSELIPEQACS